MITDKRFRSNTSLSLSLVIALGVMMSACGSRNMSFDLLSESATFNQSASTVNGKIDILFVIDNSGSMATSQNALASNFQQFIKTFNQNGYDFQIAVTTSDAYKDDFNSTLGMAVYRNGTYTSNGQTIAAPKILTKDTPNLELAFAANIQQGTSGSGDERTLESMKAALGNAANAALGFPRADSYLSIIALSDEDDFSWNGTTYKENLYNDPALYTVQSYVDSLDLRTASSSTNRHYNFNSIAVQDDACRTALGAGPDRKIAIRQNNMASLTNGILGSICADFGVTLATISNKIIELSTQFFLPRTPQASSLKVYVSGVQVALSDTNGYSYNSANNSITFHGTAVPPAGSSIGVSYTPTELR